MPRLLPAAAGDIAKARPERCARGYTRTMGVRRQAGRPIRSRDAHLRVIASGPAFLDTLTDELNKLGDATVIKRTSSALLLDHLGADRVAFLDRAEAGGFDHAASSVRPQAGFGTDDTADIPEDPVALDALSAGHAVCRDDAAPARGRSRRRRTAARAWAIVPSRSDGSLVSVLIVQFREAHRWTQAEMRLIAAAGHRTWSAAEQARRCAEIELRLENCSKEMSTVFTQLVGVQERERMRIARDLHDSLGQQMTAMRIALDSLRALSWPIPELARQAAHAEELARGIDRAIDELTRGLRSDPLQNLGLSAALDHLVSDWAEQHQIVADYGSSGLGGQRFDADIEINLFRIAQEALNNVVKHAQATRVSVSLERRPGRLQLVIEDDGRGMDPSAVSPPPGTFGLVGMRERAALFGGSVEIESRPGHGATVFVRLPWPRERAGER
jgi:signal transduction histidine kinase